MTKRSADTPPAPAPRGEEGAHAPLRAEREPIPSRDSIARQNQHVPRYQDGGREANGGKIDKHGGDLQRKDVDRGRDRG